LKWYSEDERSHNHKNGDEDMGMFDIEIDDEKE